MFDLIYKKAVVEDKSGNPVLDRNGKPVEKIIKRTPEEIKALSKEERSDLNLIHKKWGGGRFMSMRLNSFISNEGERVTHVLLEFGITDANDKLTECNKIYMKLPEFAWFCELLKSGMMRERVERTCKKVYVDARKAYEEAVEEAAKRGLEKPDYREFLPTQKDYSVPVYTDYGGSEKECRVLKVYTGWSFKENKRSEMICFEAGKGPGKKNAKGGIQPHGWTKDNSSRVMVGFTDDELGIAGTMGLYAMDLINYWNARGDLEDNLALLNPDWSKEDRGKVCPQQSSRQKQQDRDYDNRGFGDEDGFGYAAGRQNRYQRNYDNDRYSGFGQQTW